MVLFLPSEVRKFTRCQLVILQTSIRRLQTKKKIKSRCRKTSLFFFRRKDMFVYLFSRNYLSIAPLAWGTTCSCLSWASLSLKGLFPVQEESEGSGPSRASDLWTPSLLLFQGHSSLGLLPTAFGMRSPHLWSSHHLQILPYVLPEDGFGHSCPGCFFSPGQRTCPHY